MRRIAAVAVAALAIALVPDLAASQADQRYPVQIEGPWVLESGITGTYDHFGNPPFGPPTFLCGIAFDLRYRGGEPIETLDVAALLPEGFSGHVAPGGEQFAAGWRRPSVVIRGRGSLADSMRLGHIGGGVGTICRSGPSDLDAVRGTILKVAWRSRSGEHEQTFTIDLVRGDQVTMCGGQLSADGQLHPVWKTRSCE